MALKFEITGDNSNLLRSLDGARTGVKRAAQDIEESGLNIEDMFKRIAAAAGIAFSLDQAKNLVGNIMKVRGQFQQLEIAFGTMLQSEEKAGTLMSQLIDTAAKTPFDLQGVSEGAKQLLAYGTAADEVNETITRLGDIAAGLSIPLGDLVYLYGTTMKQGRMYTMDLRQFQGRGIPMADELAKIFGVAEDEVSELVTAGRVGAEQVKQAIWNMTNAGGKFGGLMAAQSSSITGQISNIEDAIDTMLNDIGKQNEGVFNAALSGVSNLVENYKDVGAMLMSIAAAFGTYKAAVVAVSVAQKVNITILRQAVIEKRLAAAASTTLGNAEAIAAAKGKLLAIAQKQVIASLKGAGAILTNPYVLLAAAVGAAVYGIYKLVTAETAQEQASKALGNRLEVLTEYQQKYNDETEEAIKLAEDSSAATIDRDEALQLLIARYPQIIQKYIDEQGQLRNILDLKKEIADYDNQKQKQEKTETLRQTGQNAWSNYKIADKLIKSGLTTRGLNAVEKSQAEQLREQYSKDTGKTFASMQAIRDYYKSLAASSRTAYARNLTENKISDFTKEGGALGGYTDTQLSALQKSLQDYASKKYEKTAVFIKGIDDYLTAEDRQTLLTRVGAMISARSEKKGSSSDWAEAARKKWVEAEKEYKDYINSKDNSVSKTTFEKKAKELKDAADIAKKAYEELGGSGKTSSDSVANEQEKLRKLQEDGAQEEQRTIKDLENKVTNATLSVMKDRVEKVRLLREQRNKEELEAIERQKEDAVKKYKDQAESIFDQQEKVKKASNQNYTPRKFNRDSVDTSAIVQKYNELIRLKKEEQVQAMQEESLQSLRQYIKEYGSLEERRLAITQEYAERINEATTIGEKMSLQRQQEEALSNLDMEALKKDIDWEHVFNDLDVLSVESLKNLKKRLKDALDAKDVSAENAEVLSEQINRIDEQISTKNNEWRSAFGMVIPELERVRRLKKEEEEAQEKLNKVQERQNELLLEKTNLQLRILSLAQTKGVSIANSDQSSEISTKDSSLIISAFSDAGKGTEQITSLFSDLGSTESALVSNTEALSAAQGAAGTAATSAAGSFAGAVAIIDAIIHNVNDQVQSTMELIEQSGNADTKFGKGFKSFAESSQYATDAWESLKQGNIMGVVNGVYGSLRTLGDTLGQWGIGIFGSSDTNLQEDIERLTQSNEALKFSIDALAEEMEDSAVADAESIYKQQKERYLISEANTREIMQRTAAAYSNGFLGIGGEKSSNSKIDTALDTSLAEMYGYDVQNLWDDISELLGKEIRSAGQFFSLSSKEMYEVAKKLPDVYAKIKDLADDGYGNAAQYMDEYIEYWEQLQELEDAYLEKLTSVSFDSIQSDFVSALSDMDSDAADFAEDFEEYMQQAILNSLVSEQYKPMLEKWYRALASYMKDGEITEKEMAALRESGGIYFDDTTGQNVSFDSWESITNSALAARDALKDVFGWDSTYSQNASDKGFETMSQETAGELNGRFTALQISGDSIVQQTAQMYGQMLAMAAIQISSNNSLLEIRNMMITANSYLEDTAKYSKKMYLEFGSKLDSMIDNTKNL